MAEEALEPAWQQAAREALEHFPVAASDLRLVRQSENLTFRVNGEDPGEAWVLRLHRPGYNTLAELDSERLWTRALAAAGIAVPQAMRTRTGDNYVLVGIPGTGEQRYAGLTRWIEGTPLALRLEQDPGPEFRLRAFRWIGEMIARLHNQATAWQPPPGFTRRRLDVDGLLGEAPAWGRFWEHAELRRDERERLLRKRRELRRALEEYGERPATFGLVHADVDPNNIICTPGGALALIDFDDAAYSWHVYDLALTLDEFLYAPDLEALAAAMIDGYRAHRPLAEADLAMLPLFMLIRGMSMIGWYHERPEHAGSDFFEEIRAWTLARCR